MAGKLDHFGLSTINGLYGYHGDRLRENKNSFSPQVAQLWARYQLPQADLLVEYKFYEAQEELDRVHFFGRLPLDWVKARSVKAMTNCLIIDDITEIKVQQVEALHGYKVVVQCSQMHPSREHAPYMEIAEEASVLLHPIANDLIIGGRSWVKRRDNWGQWK